MSERYDTRTIVLHWTIAIIIALMWGGAHMIDWFPKGSPRVDARSVHIVLGTLLLLLVFYRIFWRLNHGIKISDPAGPATLAAKGVHYLLYALILTTVFLGLANTWVRGDSLFNLGNIPAFGVYSKEARHALSESIVGWHELGANLILILAGAHALMGLVHHYVLKDGVLKRMLRG